MSRSHSDHLADAVLSGDRSALARAITLVESTHADHAQAAQDLLVRLLPDAGKAIRIGITGVPGVGKSTFIDAFGSMLTAKAHKVAVLAIDPSSRRTSGSILADKTRMGRLAADPNAFIRPSPTGGALGGVARATREAMVVCEAAGFDVIIIETVGTGQSEMAVADMVDFFLVLILPGAGDELQGIKKGVLEAAHMIAVNKADGDNMARAKAAARDYQAALHILTPASPNWRVPVVTCSAKTGAGLEDIWRQIGTFRDAVTTSGEWAERRKAQAVRWMWALIEDRLSRDFRAHAGVRKLLPQTEQDVAAGRLTPALAAARLLDTFRGKS